MTASSHLFGRCWGDVERQHPDLPIIALTNHGPVCLGLYRPEVLALNSRTPCSGFPHPGVNVATLQKGSSLPRINLVFHEDLPGVGVTNIDSCVIALIWPDAIFRDSGYLVADCTHLNKLVDEFGIRYVVGCIMLLDGLLTVKRTNIFPVPHLNRVLRI